MAAVEFEVDGHIALVTLNRPEARNAFNPEALVRLYNAFKEIEKVYGNLDNYMAELDFGESKMAKLRDKLLV